jgi:hypothetical protein
VSQLRRTCSTAWSQSINNMHRVPVTQHERTVMVNHFFIALLDHPNKPHPAQPETGVMRTLADHEWHMWHVSNTVQAAGWFVCM